VKLFPDVPNTYDSLAEGYLKVGDKASAVKYYRMVLDRDPENDRVRKILERLNAKK
jgi:hypothetical protein